MTLVWRKELEIGDEAIDTDHKYLICLINTVELTLRVPEHRDILPTTLAQLELHPLVKEDMLLRPALTGKSN